LQSVCPPKGSGGGTYNTSYDFSFYCQNVIRAWSGGVADTKRNRLIMFGGGHTDYYGNEVYALNLSNLTISRLTNPSPISGPVQNPSCNTTLSDGTPNSRHSYSGLAYITHADKMFVYGGSLACASGGGGDDTWTFDFATLKWTKMNPGGAQPVGYNLAAVADYNPNDKQVYLFDRNDLFRYSLENNTYTRLGSAAISVYMNGVIDPKRNLFVLMGMNDDWTQFVVQAVDLKSGSTYARQTWSTTGCNISGAKAPGMTYDSSQDRIIVWPNNGNTVYVFNPDTKSCSQQTISGGPAASAHNGSGSSNGTYGRFRYFPSLGVIAAVNDWNINAYTLRLSSGGGTPAPTPSAPVISGVSASNVSTSGATINWNTDVPSTSQVQYGTTTSYGSNTPVVSTLMSVHSVGLSGLSAGTTYHYRVISADSGGRSTTSGDFTFTTGSSTPTQPPPAPTPIISTVSPGSGTQGQTITTTVSGSNFASGAACNFGSGITVSSCSFVSASQLRASVAVSTAATTGSRTVTVTNPDGKAASLAGGFLVNASSDTGGTGGTGSTNRINFNYADRASLLNAGWGYVGTTASGATRNTEGSGTLAVDYSQTSHAGAIRIPLGTGELWQSSNNSQNMLLRSLPSDWTSIRLKIQSFSPTADYQQVGLLAYQNDDNYLDVQRNYQSTSGGPVVGFFKEQGAVTSRASRLNLSNTGNLILRLDRNSSTNTFTAYYSTDGGTTWANLGSLTQTLSATKLGIQVGANTSTSIPKADLAWVEILTAGGGGGTTKPAPTLSSVTPNSGKQGQTLNVNVAGSNLQSGVRCAFGTGVTVNSCTYSSASQATASVTVASSAATGARSVTVTNPDGQTATLSNAFNVTATTTTSGPVISGLSAGSIGTNTATIAWTTDVPSTSQVQYGPSASFGFTTPVDSVTVTNHAVTLSNLSQGTTYYYRVVSSNPNNGTQTTSGTQTFATTGSTGTGSADFQTRCNGTGVVRCWGFDDAGANSSHIVGKSGFTPPSTATDVKASGTGSLKFTIQSQSHESAAGYFWLNFLDDLSKQVGPGQDIYIQWRQRFSPEFLSTYYQPGDGWKQAIIGEGDRPGYTANSCTDLEVVMQNVRLKGIPRMYVSCAYYTGLQQYITTPQYPISDVLYQNGNDVMVSPYCRYNNGGPVNIPPCVGYNSNEWMTFQVHIKPGQWWDGAGGGDPVSSGPRDGTVEAWAGHECQASKQIINFSPARGTGVSFYNSNPSQAKYGKVWLLPYMTNKDATQVTPTAYTWYDELVISTQRIPDPKCQ
jgi:hypothetical protein